MQSKIRSTFNLYKLKQASALQILLIVIPVIFLGILTLLIWSGPASVGGTDDKGASTQNTTRLPSAPSTSWPMFRGGQSLSGIGGKLSDSLKLYWKFRTDRSVKSSAAIENGRVYFGSDDGKVYCLDLTNGREIWSFQTEDSVEASPCVLNGSVFVGSSDEFLYALDAETGNLKWKYKTDGKVLGAANWSFSAEGDRAWILVGSYDNKLHCVDSLTGQAAWTYETESYINGTPAIAEGKAVFGGCDAIIHVVSIAEGEEVSEIETDSYIAGSPALVGKYAYAGNYGGELIAADIVDNQVLWTYVGDESPFFSSPAVGENQVIIGARDERLHCVDRESGKLLWSFRTRGNIDSSPAICDGKVVVGSDDGRLYIVRLSDGVGLWSYEIGEALTASPAIANGMVIIGSEDGYVYAFGPSDSNE